MIAALASAGRARISNFSTSEDCAATLACLSRLGVTIKREDDGGGLKPPVLSIEGVGPEMPEAPAQPLDCRNSGSTMRLLAGVLAGQDFVSILTGDASLRSRPMKRIIEPLELMGARVSSEGNHHNYCAPLRIEGRKPLAAIRYEMPVASAQVKSCILLAGLGAEGRTEVVERPSAPTRDHTERMLRWFGVPVETSATRLDETPTIAVTGPARFAARDIAIPGDISAATFFIAAAALLPGSHLRIRDVGLNPTRTQILRTLETLDAEVRMCETGERCHENIGEIEVRGTGRFVPGAAAARENGSVVIRGPAIAALIDELPALAVVGTQVEGGLRIREAGELRVKESDRIRATVENLRAMGAEVEEYEDGLGVAGPVRLRGARLESYGDHRIAMAFTVAALIAEGESEIVGAEECVRISFPEFFQLLESVIE